MFFNALFVAFVIPIYHLIILYKETLIILNVFSSISGIRMLNVLSFWGVPSQVKKECFKAFAFQGGVGENSERFNSSEVCVTFL